MPTIAELNDAFRKDFTLGRVLTTPGIQALPVGVQMNINAAIMSFDAFTEDNDPYGEHDFGSVEVNGHKVFWKIDYYDNTLTYGAENPLDVKNTLRVMTIMLAEEY